MGNLDFVKKLYNGKNCYSDHMSDEELELVHIHSRVEDLILELLESRKIVFLTGNPGDGHLPVLQRLAHQVQGILPEFRKLVQEEHPLVGHGDFPGLRIAAAAHKTGVGNRVVGCPEGATGDQRLLGGQKAHDRVDGADLQTLCPGHIRQDGGQPLGQHGFAGAGCAGQKHVVPACGCNDHGAPRQRLPHHVRKIRHLLPCVLRVKGDGGGRGEGADALQCLHHLPGGAIISEQGIL